MKKIFMLMIVMSLLVVMGCAKITITKTAKGVYSPTNPDNVQVLVLAPKADFIELATVTTWRWDTCQTAKMHNSLRAKSAPLGADAVVLGDSGIDMDGYFWSSGVAIKYKK